tara:strand:+ start:527 stop:991 length:465 start_codon:yes stop_codon:yes gene_type:complete
MKICMGILVLILFTLDQYSKYLIRLNFDLFQSKSIFYLLDLIYVPNYGVAFNILNNESLNLGFVFSLFVFFICLYLVWLIFINQVKTNNIELISLSLILAGGLGNLIDRVSLGYVVDFIAITFNPYVFNFADVYITIGIMLYLINYLLVKEQNS